MSEGCEGSVGLRGVEGVCVCVRGVCVRGVEGVCV